MKHLALAGALALATATSALAEGETHYLAIHVDQADAQVMNMALNNAQNVRSYYAEQGDEVVIEIVAYGPGLMMLRDDKSPVKGRLSQIQKGSFPSKVTYSACGNTKKKMEKKAGKSVKIVSQARVVPAGVVRLTELQEQGWTYIRP